MAEKIRLDDRECPLSSTLGLVGEWWTLLILHDAFDGYARFDEFEANLGISSSLLTSRLKRLVANGLLERRQYQAHPPRYEYVLTDLGRSLRPVIIALAAWGNARLPADARSMVLVDSETGVEAEPVLVDRASGRRVDGPDFVFSAGPAASKPFRDRYEGRPGPSNQAHSRESRSARILERVRAIPRGSVRTYSEIDPEAPRVVGRVLATTHEKVPWHRVVRTDGSAPLGAEQLALLRKERVPMHGDRVDLARAQTLAPRSGSGEAGRMSGEPHRNATRR